MEIIHQPPRLVLYRVTVTVIAINGIFSCKYVSSNSTVCRLFVKMAGDEYAKL